jgi:hypothetical protein
MSCPCTGEFANVYLTINNLEGNFNAITGNTLSNYNQLSRIVSQQANIYNTLYYGAGDISTGNLSVSANALISGNLTLISGNLIIGNDCDVVGPIKSQIGYKTRTGSNGIFGSNHYNFNWTGSNVDCYIDVSRIGALSFTDKYVSGQVIQALSFGPYNITPAQYVFSGNNVYETWVSLPFTPKSTSSYIMVHADALYRISGGLTDTFWVQVIENLVDNKYEKTQEFNNFSGGGTRSGVLFPLMCSYINSTTTTRNIVIRLKRGASDDTITMTASLNTHWSVVITEIQV